MKKLVVLFVTIVLMSACSVFNGIQVEKSYYIPVKKMGTMLNDSLRVPYLKNKETGVLTFANLNELNKTDALGRYLQERLMFYMFKNGFRLKELRLAKHNRYLPKTGEINITRLKSELKESGFGKLESIVVGTYIDAGNHYYVSAKLIELKNGLVRASGEIKITKGKYLDKLTSNKQDEGKQLITYERKPVLNSNMSK